MLKTSWPDPARPGPTRPNPARPVTCWRPPDSTRESGRDPVNSRANMLPRESLATSYPNLLTWTPPSIIQVLREVLHQAGGVQVLDGWSITQAQVDGKGGGEVLRQENASFGSTVKPVRKAKNFLQVIYLVLL